MKIVRFETPSGDMRYAWFDEEEKIFELDGDIFDSPRRSNRPAEIARLLAPIEPAVILCMGLNYKAHAKETKAQVPERPILFMKNPAALQHPGQPIFLPRHLRSDRVDYEAELAVVIGRRCKNVGRTEALDYVLGYTCANDVSARDWQIKWGGGQWCRAKSFDTFAPMGPCLVTPDDIENPNALRIRTRVNGRTLQDSNTADMIFDLAGIIEFLSGSTTLKPGTVIFTGTPEGVGMARDPKIWLQPGDKVEIEIEKIGILENPVREEI
jgi:2-keto-4-pentenoate hydratase/2-oxohepta-3-ene-1,7-dioic acid hydratase in catechol pathway